MRTQTLNDEKGRVRMGIAIFAIILLVALLGLYSINIHNKAYAETLEAGDYDLYTVSDDLRELETYTIYNYKESLESYEGLYGQSVVISNTSGLFMNNCVYNYSGNLNLVAGIYGDDNITRIIPEELFANSGSTLYIGEEYGFYIDTVSQTSLINSSTVLVFDITNQPDININNTRPNFKVEVLFQYKYLYIKASTSVSVTPLLTYTYNLSGCSNVVIPAVDLVYSGGNLHGSTEHSPEIQQSMSYALSDISFAAFLENEQHLNESDDFYSAISDNGMFFIQEEYAFQGKAYQNGYITNENLLELIENTAEFALGFVPYLGDFINISNYLFDVSEIDGILSGYIPVGYSYNLGVEEYLADKPNQINEYGRLLKEAATIINTPENNTVLFTQGDSAEIKYGVTQTTESKARLNRTIGIKIYSLTQNKFVDIETDTRYFTINNPEYKEASVGIENEVYTLPLGTDYFQFSPEYDGFYGIDLLSNPISYLLKSNGNEQTLSANNDYYLEQGNTYQIEITNTINNYLQPQFRINIISENTQNLNIRPNGNYVIRYFTPNNEIVNLLSLNTDCIIDEVFYYESNGQKINLDINSSTNSSFIASANLNYYIVLENQSNNSYTVTLDISNSVSTIENSLLIFPNNNSQYLAYASSNDGYHIIRVNNSTQLEYVIYDSSFQEISYIQLSTGIKFLLPLGETAYISFKLTGSNIDNTYLNCSPEEYNLTLYDVQTVVNSFSVRYNASIELPARIRTGYLLDGWTSSGNLYINTYTHSFFNNATFDTVWSPIQYTIVYNNNSLPLETVNSSSYTYGQSITLENNTFIKAGYSFIGWSYQANTYYEESSINYNLLLDYQMQYIDTMYLNEQNELSIYANWLRIIYYVKYYHEGILQEIPYNIETLNFSLPNLTLRGHTFINWYEDIELTTMADVTITQGSTGDIYFYPKFAPNNYSIVFNPEGGSVSPLIKAVTFCQTIGELPIPTKNGYEFVICKTQPNGNGDTYNQYTVFDETEDIGLYAVWTIESYAIKFEIGDDTNVYRWLGAVVVGGENTITILDTETFLPYNTPFDAINLIYIFKNSLDGYKEGEKFSYFQYNQEITWTTIPDLGENGHTIVITPKYVTEEYKIIFTTQVPEYGFEIEENYGSPITFPNPIRQGYDFLGWFKYEYNQARVNYLENVIYSSMPDLTPLPNPIPIPSLKIFN